MHDAARVPNPDTCPNSESNRHFITDFVSLHHPFLVIQQVASDWKFIYVNSAPESRHARTSMTLVPIMIIICANDFEKMLECLIVGNG
jgi:hypothetical protein